MDQDIPQIGTDRKDDIAKALTRAMQDLSKQVGAAARARYEAEKVLKDPRRTDEMIMETAQNRRREEATLSEVLGRAINLHVASLDAEDNG